MKRTRTQNLRMAVSFLSSGVTVGFSLVMLWTYWLARNTHAIVLRLDVFGEYNYEIALFVATLVIGLLGIYEWVIRINEVGGILEQ